MFGLSLVVAALSVSGSPVQVRDATAPPRPTRFLPGAVRSAAPRTTSGASTQGPLGPVAPLAFPAPGISLVDGAGGSDFGYSLVVAPGGATYVTGWGEGPSGTQDILTLKLDAMGNVVWRRWYDGSGSGSDAGFQVGLDPQGNVVVVGGSNGASTGDDVTVLEYSPDGQLLWEYLYDGAGGFDNPQGGRPLAIDSNGDVVVVAISWGGATSFDGLVLRLDDNGAPLFTYRYDGAASFDDFYSVGIDSQGAIYAGGGTTTPAGDAMNLVKLDALGSLIWERQFDESPSDLLYDLAITPGGDIGMCGFTRAGNREDFTTLRYDSSGNLLWSRTLDAGMGGSDIPFWIEAGPSGELAVVGWSEGAFVSLSGWLLVYDASGNLTFQDRQGTGQSWYADVDFTSTGEIIAAGHTDGRLESGFDTFVRRFSPSGTLLEEHSYDGPCRATEVLVSVFVDSLGGVHACGTAAGPGGNLDVLIQRIP